MAWTITSLLAVIFSLFVLIQIPAVQTWLAKKMVHQLETSLDATIDVEFLHFEFWHKARLEDLSINQRDKSIHINTAVLNFDVFDLLESTISIKEINLNGAEITINTDISIEKPEVKQGGQWETTLQSIHGENIYIEVLMPHKGQTLQFHFPSADLDLGQFILGKSDFHPKSVELKSPSIVQRRDSLVIKNSPITHQHLDFTALKNLNLSIDTLSINELTYTSVRDNDSVSIVNNLSGIFSIISEENLFDARAINLYANLDQYPLMDGDEVHIHSSKDAFQVHLKDFHFGSSVFNGMLDLPLKDYIYPMEDIYKTPFHLVLGKSNLTTKERDLILSKANINVEEFESFLGQETVQFDSIDVSGTLSNLEIPRLDVKSEYITVDGKANIEGLPSLQETHIKLDCRKLHVSSSPFLAYAEKSSVNLPDFCARIPEIDIAGHLEGSLEDIALSASVNIIHGEAIVNASMNWDKDSPPTYKGFISTSDFKLGQLIASKNFNKFQCDLQVDGYGITAEDLELDITGEISGFEYNNQSIDHINLNGHISKQSYNGQIEIFDNAVQLSTEAEIDQSGTFPKILASGNIDFLHVEDFTNINEALTISGKFSLDGHSIDTERGLLDLSLSDWALDFDERIVSLPPTRLIYSQLPENRMAIDVKSEFLSGFVSTDYQFTDIPIVFSSLKDGLRVPYLDGKSASWNINLSDSYDLLALFNPDLDIPRKLRLDGSIGGPQNTLQANWSTDEIHLGQYTFEGFNGSLNFNDNAYEAQSALKGITLFDTTFFKNIEVAFLKSDEIGQFSIQSKDGNQDSLLHLMAFFERDEKDNLQGRFSSFDIHLDTNVFRIDKENQWYLSNNQKLELKNFILEGNGNGNVRLEGYPYTSEEDQSEKQYFNLSLQSIRIKALSDLLNHPIYKFDGEADFQVAIKNAFNQPELSASLDTRHLQLNTQELGRLIVVSEYNPTKKRIDIKAGSLIREAKNFVTIKGYHGLAGHLEDYDTKIIFNVDSLEVQSIEDLVPSYIRDNKGNVHGTLSLVVKDKKPNLLGYLETGKVTTTISYLNTRYNLHNQRVDFLEDRLYIPNLEAFYMDTLRGEKIRRVLKGGGNIYHKNLKDWALDVTLSGENIQVLNTTSSMNPDYYGEAYVTGSARFYGEANSNLTLEVNAESAPGTELYFPYEESAYAESHNFFTFKSDKQQRLFKLKDKVRINPLDVLMELSIDEDAKIYVVLSEEDGDILSARGNGDIRLEYFKNEDANLYGTYNIASGDYTFQLREVIDKRFYIEDGGSIQLEGPIEDAVLDVAASYRINTTPLNLIREYIDINDAAVYTEANERVPVKLLLNISNTLAQPAIEFDIDIVDYDPILRNPIETKINLLRNDVNNMNQQVFGLIVVNQFIPTFSDAGGSNAAMVSTGLNNTVSELLSNQLSGYLSGWFDELNLDLDLNINYRAYDPSVNNGEDLAQIRRRELQIALSKRFLNDRMTINVGGNVDFGDELSEAGNSGTNFTGDFEFNYAITEDRRLKFKAFSNTDYDIFDQGYRTNAGLGISFSRNFNNIKELFGKNRESNKKVSKDNAQQN